MCIYNNYCDSGTTHNEATSTLQFCVGDKLWTATGNVHVKLWLPEKAAHGDWLEYVGKYPSLLPGMYKQVLDPEQSYYLRYRDDTHHACRMVLCGHIQVIQHGL